MSTLTKLFSKKELSQLFINLVSYMILLVYAGFQLVTVKDNPLVQILSLVALIFLSFSFLKEGLNYIYKDAIYALTQTCDPVEGLIKLQSLIKYDLLRNYRPSIWVFKVLAAIDQQDLEALKTLTTQELSKSSRDFVLIKSYALYWIEVIQDHRTQIKKTFTSLIKLKDIKVKGKSFSALFAWSDIEAHYELLFNDPRKAKNLLNATQIQALNPRELNWHYNLLALAQIALEDEQAAIASLKLIKVSSHPSPFIVQATKTLEKLEKKNETRKKSR